MKEFEYNTASIEYSELILQLNAMGNKGWEVVAVLDKDTLNRNVWFRFLFKREMCASRDSWNCGPL